MMVRLLLLCVLAPAAVAGPSGRHSPVIDSLIVLQDLRASCSPLLSRSLRSGDSTVVALSTIVAANLQDTSVVDDLIPLLRSPHVTVRENAALALGQLGPLLRPDRRSVLQAMVLSCIERGPSNDRLVEECGKFGDSLLLNSLVARAGKMPDRLSRGLLLGIARFAIRGIVTLSSEHALLQACATSAPVPWEAVYALQRAGDRHEVRNSFHLLEPLRRSSNPLVRMNLVSLAGKLRDFPPALQLIESMIADADWRVRVNLARALIQWPDTNAVSVLGPALRSINDANPHVAVALVGSLENARPVLELLARGESFGIVRWLDSVAALQTISPVGLRAPVLNVLARVEGQKLLPRLARLCTGGSPATPEALGAMGRTGAPSALPLLIDSWYRIRRTSGNGDLASQRKALGGALDGIDAWLKLRDTVPSSEKVSVQSLGMDAIRSGDVALVAGGAELLSALPLRDRTMINGIRQALRRLKLPDDIEGSQALVHLLNVLGDSSATVPACPIVERVPPSHVQSLPDTIRVLFRTSKGSVNAELYTAAAPFTVANIAALAERGFYSSTATRPMQFHRVVPNFVIQGGDPRGDGWGGPGFSLRTEISTLRFETGSIGMASAGRDTEGSQFFITHSPQPHLDGRYTVFGRVVHGMEVVDQLQVGDTLETVTIPR